MKHGKYTSKEKIVKPVIIAKRKNRQTSNKVLKHIKLKSQYARF